ncbi:MAG: glycosyl hydrolase, partial [Armatimonadia bacterium]|nr:glycosyl hydrolase [Armatimonadia bacterium]
MSLMLLSLLLGPSQTVGAPVQAVPASEFLDSLGVCSAVSVRGETLEDTIRAIEYTGLRWLRLGYESDLPTEDLLALHEATGARFSYGLQSGGSDIPRLLEGARRLAQAGALVAIEGNNEPNNWTVTYQGEEGGGDLSWLPVAKLQRDLYEAVKSDPLLADAPVWAPTEPGAQTDNVGLQYLTIPEGADTLMPPGTTYADYANCHNYLTHPSWPGLHENQTWIAADPGPECKVDGLYGNYGVTWRNHFRGYSVEELQDLPRVTTETGVTIGGEITERTQAVLILSCYLDQFTRGWSHTAVYLLRDRVDEAGNQTFGFYRPDYTPRLSAVYVHNLTTILDGDGRADGLGTLDYTIGDQPETVHDLLLQKADGTLMLVVWGERFLGGTDSITVDLGEAFGRVSIYDPTAGPEPVVTVSDIRSLDLGLTDHPLV